jgi:outer membrane protein
MLLEDIKINFGAIAVEEAGGVRGAGLRTMSAVENNALGRHGERVIVERSFLMKKAFRAIGLFSTTVAILSSAFVFQPAVARGEDLLQLYQLSIAKDPQYKGASYQRLALKEGVKQAQAALRPTVDLQGNMTETRQKVANSENQVFADGSSTYMSTTLGPTVNIPLLQVSLFVQLHQKKQIAKRADVDYELAKQDLIFRLAKAYVAAQTAADNVVYAKEEKKDVEAFVERADVRFKSGLAPNTDLYDAQARLASVEASIVKSENEYQTALQALASMTGAPVQSAFRLKDGLPLVMPNPAKVEDWTNMGLEKSLEILSRQYDADTARRGVSLQKSANLPTLNAVGQVTRNDMGGSLYGGGAVVNSGTIALNLDVPIFEGFAVKSKVREAKDRYQESLQNLEQQKRDVILHVTTAFSGVKTAISRAEALKKSIDAQTEIYNAKGRGYRSGVYTSLAVLDAAKDLYLYRRDYSVSRYDYVMNTLELKKAVGTLSEEDLILINNWLAQ